MRVLVTGAAGFIGKAVCPLLQANGHTVVGVDAFVPEVHEDRGEWPESVEERHACSVMHYVHQYRRSSSAPIDAVIHLAARVGVGQSQYRIEHYVKENVAQTAALMEWCSNEKVPTVIVASSMSTYGEGAYFGMVFGEVRRAPARGYDAFEHLHDDRQWHPTSKLTPMPTREHHPQRPLSVYGQTKLDQEHYVRIVGDAYNLRTVALRLWNVYGPGQALSNPYTGVLAGFAGRLLNGHPPLLFEDGLQTRDFIYVDDVARAFVLALENPTVHGAFNICTGRATSILALAEEWIRVAKKQELITVEMAPVVDGRVRAGDVRHCVGAPDAFMGRTGWSPRVALEEGLELVGGWVWRGSRTVHHETRVAIAELEEHGLLS